ncbi:hypothetical protein RCL1_006018 [Eukaryota sp. TZLM3-RCL]
MNLPPHLSDCLQGRLGMSDVRERLKASNKVEVLLIDCFLVLHHKDYHSFSPNLKKDKLIERIVDYLFPPEASTDTDVRPDGQSPPPTDSHVDSPSSCFMCIQENCSYSFSDFSYVGNLSEGSQGQTSIRKGKDGKLYCFKSVSAPCSGTLPEVDYMLRQLHSPFLVDVLHCFHVDNLVYLCMEYVEGGSLHDLLSESNFLHSDDIWLILVQLAIGLNELHSNSIIHRDIKPANIVLTSKTPPFGVKYCDFGVSKHVQNSMARTFVGTFQFMAPEVVKMGYGEVLEDSSYTSAVDLWSLGVVLYWLVEKQFPFANPTEILSGNIPVSNSEFGEIIAKLLVTDPSQRISAQELVNLSDIKRVCDFFKEKNFDDPSTYRLWRMSKEIQRQSDLIDSLNNTVEVQKSKIYEQNYELADLRSSLVSQEENQMELNSKILSQNLKVLDLERDVSHALAQTLTPEQSNLIAQCQTLLPVLSQLAKQHTHRQEENRQEQINGSKYNGYLLASRFPKNIFSHFGNVSKFVPETKGLNLLLSENDLVVESKNDGRRGSFVLINHPVVGKVTLTLRSTGIRGCFESLIGFFRPSTCQEPSCYSYFTGIRSCHEGTDFLTNEVSDLDQTMSISHSVEVSFDNNIVTYSTPHTGWSRTVDCVHDWVFGMSVYSKNESWKVE